MMLSSGIKQCFFLSDMPMLGLFNYRAFPFQRLKVLMFSDSKVFCFTNVESVRNFVRVIFETKCSLEILQRCKIIQTVCCS